MARKNEGRFEVDAGFSFKGASGIINPGSGRSLQVGVNYSGLLNDAYTFRKVKSDTGNVRLDEWQDLDILTAYLEGKIKLKFGILNTDAKIRAEFALPGGDAQFTKINSNLETGLDRFGLNYKVRGNLAFSFGPDNLPAQDAFYAESASPRERFRNDILKTGNALLAFSRRFVEGGGYLRGYSGQPLPAEKFATVNFELTTSRSYLFAMRPFVFYDTGKIWDVRGNNVIDRSDAGFGVSFLSDELNLFGGNLELFANLNAKVVFPIWLSDPLPGEKKHQFRWLFTLGKGL
jgi:hemolysin activation/secretion protein